MTLDHHQLHRLHKALRQVPEGRRDDAAKFFADLLRPILEPSETTIDRLIHEMRRRYDWRAAGDTGTTTLICDE